jgi:Type I restriction-modification system methyltransferase subunit
VDHRTYVIADALLAAVREKFLGDYTDVPKIKVFWHNTVYLFFSFVNYRRLANVSDIEFDEMKVLGLMPEYLSGLYDKERKIFDKYIDTAVVEYFSKEGNVGDCRQELLNVELDFTDGGLALFTDKVSRDNTGSYYTPKKLAEEIIKKTFIGRNFEEGKSYKIADFSCGGGEFFLAIMNYLKEENGIDYRYSIGWFYGVDIDPIALQICIVNLLQYADRNEWETVISHFTFGNPLVISDKEFSEEEKNSLYAMHRLYSAGLGMPESFFEECYDVIVGNPPWEKIRFEERKFFKGIANDISNISQKNVRDAEVEKLKDTWPAVYEWRNKVRDEYAQMTAAKYKHCRMGNAVAGELNTYALFTELAYHMLSDNGFLAIIVKSTLVTAPAHKKLWSAFLFDRSVSGVYMFDNKTKIFSIDSRERFIVFVAAKERKELFEFAVGLREPEMLCIAKPIMLAAEDLSIINPFTRTIPNVSNNDEISFLKKAHNHFRLFSDVYPDCHFGRLIHLTAHAASIDKKASMENVPIYEGKFIEQYDARYATFHGVPDSKKYVNKASAVKINAKKNGRKELPECRYFVHKELWDSYLHQYNKEYSLCWRSLTSPTNRRTMLAMILPTCPTCQSVQMLQTENEEDLVLLLALFNSIPFDYFVRIKMPGLDLTQSVIKQIPVPAEDDYKEVVKFNGKEATLKRHILSYTVSILQEESRLSGLVGRFEGDIYAVEGYEMSDKQKMIDLLFKEAYHLDDAAYKNILLTFPKY